MTDELLPCGRDPLEVWDHVADGRFDGHEATCPYCQGVAAEYEALSEPTREWRSASIEAPAALLDRVMLSVRAGLRSADHLALPSPDGPARISIYAASGILRWVVDQVDGARARSCRIEVGSGALVVHLSLVARPGVRIPQLVDEVRARVGRGGRELLGLEIVAVDIEVEDLWEVTP